MSQYVCFAPPMQMLHVHFCYICTDSTRTAYSYSVFKIDVQTREECASLYTRTALGLQMQSLVPSSMLHALHRRLKQTSMQRKRVNSLPLKTFGTTFTKMDLEPSYDLLKLANPKSSCRHDADVCLVAPIHSLSIAACLWQQLYCMSAKGSMQSSMPFMDDLYHSLHFLFTACLLF